MTGGRGSGATRNERQDFVSLTSTPTTTPFTMFRNRRGSETSNTNGDVPGINVTEASPRPDITPRMSSRPAVRVNRLQRPSQSPLINNRQPGSQYQNRTPQPPPRLPHPARQRSTSDPTGRAPVEIARTPRGAPTLAPAPPGAVHAEPHNTIPIPASVPGEGVRPDTVAATTGLSEPPGSAGSWGRRSWIPFRRRAQDSEDSEAQHLEGEVNGINGHDYATGTSEADRAAEQYADDVVDWLDVIGEHYTLSVFRFWLLSAFCLAMLVSSLFLCGIPTGASQLAPQTDSCRAIPVRAWPSHSPFRRLPFSASPAHRHSKTYHHTLFNVYDGA